MKSAMKIVSVVTLLPLLAVAHIITVDDLKMSPIIELIGLSLIASMILAWVFLEDKIRLLRGNILKNYTMGAVLVAGIAFFLTIVWMFIMGYALEGLYEQNTLKSDFLTSVIAMFPIWITSMALGLGSRAFLKTIAEPQS